MSAADNKSYFSSASGSGGGSPYPSSAATTSGGSSSSASAGRGIICKEEALVIEPEFPSSYNPSYGGQNASSPAGGFASAYPAGYNPTNPITSGYNPQGSSFSAAAYPGDDMHNQPDKHHHHHHQLAQDSASSAGSNTGLNSVAPFEIGDYLGLSRTDDLPQSAHDDSTSSPGATVTLQQLQQQQQQQQQKPKRKRRILEIKQIDKKSKLARDTGQEGIGRTGETIKARAMKDGCAGKKCRFKCGEKISAEERQKCFRDFWALGDHAKQWKRITELSFNKPVPVGGKKAMVDSDSDFEDDNEKKRKKGDVIIRRKYVLPATTGDVYVCKTMFCHTLNISETWIRTAMKKLENGETDMTDNRGKHKNRPQRVPDDLKGAARKHIQSFPTQQSWYYTGDSTRCCLEEGLTIAKMYDLHREKMEAEGRSMVNHHMFRDMVSNEFKYKVFINPGKEKCDQCEKYNNLEPHEKTRQVEEKHCIHSHNKKVLKELASADKQRALTDPTFCAANFDLPRSIGFPRAGGVDLLYYSKLCTWNFLVFELASFAGRCNLWTEITGKCEPKEIASFVLQFLYNRYVEGVKEFSLYSKTSSGLNRNKLFIGMLIKAANDMHIKITHRFLEKGHTNYGCQAIQAKIESYCSRKDIFTPGEFARMIWEAKPDNKYVVEEKRQEDIYDFEDLTGKFNLDLICMEDLKEVVVEPDKLSIGIKYVIDQNPNQIKVFKKGVTLKHIKELRLKHAYDGKLPLPERSKKDFLALADTDLIPPEFRHFYRSIAT